MKLSLTILFLLTTFLGFSQSRKPYSIFTAEGKDTINYEWISQNGDFELVLLNKERPDTSTAQVGSKYSKSLNRKGFTRVKANLRTGYFNFFDLKFVKELDIVVEEEDLIINYELEKKQGRGLYYVPAVSLELGGQLIINPNTRNAEITTTGFTYTYRIPNFMEKYPEWIQSGEKLTVFVDVVQYKQLITKKPSFKPLKEQLPHHIGFLVGAGFLVKGIAANNDAKKLYNDQYVNQTYQDLADPIFEKIEDKQNTARTCTIIGITVISIDAIVYFTRYFRYNKDKKLWNNFQRNPTSINRVGLNLPTYEIINGIPYTSLSLTYTF